MVTPHARTRHIRELVLFAMLGTVMFCSKILLEFLPNIHLLGVLTMVYTIVFRYKALYPIYVYVLLNGLWAGFSPWWVPYLYIWTILWGVTMLLPQKMPRWLACVLYPTICSLHGLVFGALYAPVQAILFDMTWEQTLAWIATGLSFDVIHCVGNLAAGFLILPLSLLLKRLLNRQNSVSAPL